MSKPPRTRNRKGMLIQVHLPGERLWAVVTKELPKGLSCVARLRNVSVHDIPWDTEVVVGEDGYEIVSPKSIVEKAQASVEAYRQGIN